nr:receptor like protein 27-like [Ziziphus jujuba var. spinosa]
MWSTSLDTLITFNIAENCRTSFHQSTATVLPHSNLRKLNLSFNKLRGPLPIPPSSLVDYNVSNNMLTREIPPLFCKPSSLSCLSLSNNNLSGMIPQCLGNFSDSLSMLDLRNNSLQGSIPQMCNKASNLRLIDLSYNQLQGKLPQSLSNCMALQALSLSNNQLNDVFSPWLGSFPKLKVLTLCCNGFLGVIGKPKKDLKYFPKLQIIDLSYNHFTGELPYHYMLNWNAMTEINLPNNASYMDANWVYTLPNSYGSEYIYRYTITVAYKGVEIYYSAIQDFFAFIDLSSNKFEEEILEFIGNLKALHSLNLSNKILSGCIPTSLGDLSMIESLDLSRNNLSGEIPQQLNQLEFLAYFNVSHNNLTGLISRGNQFNTMEQSSFEWNPGLCGDPLPKKCGNSKVFPPPSSIFVEDNNDLGSSIELDWKFMLAGLISGLVVGLVLGDFVTKKRQTWTWLVKNFGKWVPIRKGRQ